MLYIEYYMVMKVLFENAAARSAVRVRSEGLNRTSLWLRRIFEEGSGRHCSQRNDKNGNIQLGRRATKFHEHL
jgi:hypothetical protein